MTASKRRNPAAKALERFKPKRVPDKRRKLRDKLSLDTERSARYNAPKIRRDHD